MTVRFWLASQLIVFFSTIAMMRIITAAATRKPPSSFISYASRISCAKTAPTISSLPRHKTGTALYSTSQQQLKSIQWLKETVVQALNEAFDPVDVKRGIEEAVQKQQQKKSKEAPSPSVVSNYQFSGFTTSDAMVTPATKPEFGDYQCNAAMGLAKKVGMKPRDCSSRISDKLSPLIDSVMEQPQIAGPGFINLTFRKEYLSEAIRQMARDANGRLAIPYAAKKQKIVVDFSSPNIAKEMHVGHLRSTIIGDTLANVLEFAGHDVKRLNHVGDWGTQFGMLVEHLKDQTSKAQYNLGDLVEFYKAAKKRFDVDEEFKTRAREGVVKLQAGDEGALEAWKSLCEASRVEYQKIYNMLNIQGLEERGESFYNPFLKDMIQELSTQGYAVDSEGAKSIFLEGYTNRDGSPLPLIVRKSDGGFNYAATDLAAIQHRTRVEKADRILYVTDSGQAQHFEMVFKAAKLVGFAPSEVSLEHVPFGLVQGEDGKKFATRSGDTVKLKDLLEEAIRVAGEDMSTRMEDVATTKEVQNVIQAVGIGAVKYADLSLNRESNYKFSYTRMLSLNGNTAPYMLYAYARICGIIRKATAKDENIMMWPEAADQIILSQDAELQLARTLVKLPDILSEVESELYTNRLCDYLFETSQKFNQFYENCSVINAETPELKASRLSLCTVTAATIRLLMTLLGIQVVDRL